MRVSRVGSLELSGIWRELRRMQKDSRKKTSRKKILPRAVDQYKVRARSSETRADFC